MARVSDFLCPMGCRAYLSVRQEEEAFCVEGLVVFPSLPSLYFPLFISVRGASLLRGMVCHILLAIVAVFILKLDANSGSSRMS